jgi:hypothetical protein
MIRVRLLKSKIKKTTTVPPPKKTSMALQLKTTMVPHPKRMTTVRLPKTLMALLLRRKSDLNGPLKAKNHCFTLTPKDAPTLNHFTKPKKKNISSAEV